MAGGLIAVPPDARQAPDIIDAVMPLGSLSDVEEGRAALVSGDWQKAKHAFDLALTAEATPEALEGLGMAAWWLDLADVVFDARERAYRGYRERDDCIAAARLAVWLAWDSAAFRGDGAVANGWLGRARRLLEEQADAPEHAWLALRSAAFALFDHGDPEEAARLAADAIRIGQAIRAVDHEMVGRALHGFARVTAGRVAEGLRELDEVSAAILAGELTDRVLIGLAGCYLIAACDRVRDYGRAVQWCDRITEYCRKWGLRPLFAVCRTQYASVCMWRGAWDEAERELTHACDELAICRPGMTAEALARLGELRRRQGRLDEAVSLFERSAGHPLAALGRATVAFDRGDLKGAVELAERHLRRLPTENRTERAAALELLIGAQAASADRGDRETARAALGELTAIAEEAETVPLRASASLSSGLIALGDGDAAAARRHLEDAVDLFEKSGAPFEVARARIELARVMEKLGRTDAAIAEVDRAIESLVPLHADLELSRARALRDRLTVAPSEAANRPPPRDTGGLTTRELEVLVLIATGLSNQAIAERLFISEHTVHRHVANIFSKLNVSSRSAAVAHAARFGLL